MELTHFNDLPEAEAIEVVSVWARVPAWAEAVAGTRPFASVDELEATADRTRPPSPHRRTSERRGRRG